MTAVADAARDWLTAGADWTPEWVEAAGMAELLTGGGTYGDLLAVARVAGEVASPIPAAGVALAAAMARSAGLAVEGLVVPAFPEPGDGWPVATRDGSGVRLTGSVAAVHGARWARHLVVPARCGDDEVVAVVEREQVAVTARAVLDLTREFDRVDLDTTTARVAVVSVDRAVEAHFALYAADAVGAAGAVFRSALAHVTTRTQFGKPLGAFQAVQHRCADLSVALAAADAAVRAAGAALDSGDRNACATAVSAAAAYSAEVCAEVAASALHLHGATGFTWDHDAHRHLRRVKTDAILGGTARWHHERLATLP
ncbi:acyl-CoA dehydrogenase family protein [Actinosynnema sp. NPDC020468]|uniref:acyl-CoA dehydrogenase family protein n=1 Tax=Actinosynnema sp. NPDC020468 TaxID=3154488 RepID=UPI0033CFF0E9